MEVILNNYDIFIDYIVLFLGGFVCFTKSREGKVKYICSIFILIQILSLYFLDNDFSYILSCILPFLFVYAFFGHTIFGAILYTSIVLIVKNALSLILIMTKELSINIYHMHIFMQYVLYLGLVILVSLALKRIFEIFYETYIKWVSIVLLGIYILLIILGNLHYYIMDYYLLDTIMVIMIITLLLLIILLFMYLVLHMQSSLLDKKTNDILRLTEQQIEHLDANNKEIRKIKHDYKNQVLLLKSLLQEKKYTKMHTLLNTLEDSIVSVDNRIYTNRIYVDSVLNMKKSQEKDIVFIYDYKKESECKMDDMDISIVLMNVLDNAIYEVKNNPSLKQEIILKMVEKENIVFIKCKNPISKKKDLFTEKKEAGHGLGLSIIRSIVNKYNGELYIEQDDCFTISIMLCV